MTPRSPNTVGHGRAAATTGPVATRAPMATNTAANMATHTADNTTPSAADMAGSLAADTPVTPNQEAVRTTTSATTSGGHVAADGGRDATGDAVATTPARVLARRQRLTGRASRVVAVVAVLVGLSWCVPSPTIGHPTDLSAHAAAISAVSSAVVGALPPAQALGAVVLAQQGEAPGSQITLEQFGQNVQWLIIGFLATWTITFFMIGFARMIAARGQSEEYGKAKESLKSSLYGFLGVMLTPALFGALQSLFTSRGGR